MCNEPYFQPFKNIKLNRNFEKKLLEIKFYNFIDVNYIRIYVMILTKILK